MEVVHDVAAWRAWCERQRRAGETVGLVATMGALHAGHGALVGAARANGNRVVLTSFVNPRQFGDPADLAAYPRDVERDRALADSYGVDCLAIPTLDEMWPDYPDATPTTVSVAGLKDRLEGAGRPGHFDGVASVVAKLLVITGPARAYFGEKDFQQLCVVRQLVRDLAFDVEIIPCEIVRDDDGLALSSRNVRLSPTARARATALPRALLAVRPGPAAEMRAAVRAALEEVDLEVEYVEVVDPSTCEVVGEEARGAARLLAAIVVDGVRLIDNVAVTLKEH